MVFSAEVGFQDMYQVPVAVVQVDNFSKLPGVFFNTFFIYSFKVGIQMMI